MFRSTNIKKNNEWITKCVFSRIIFANFLIIKYYFKIILSHRPKCKTWNYKNSRIKHVPWFFRAVLGLLYYCLRYLILIHSCFDLRLQVRPVVPNSSGLKSCGLVRKPSECNLGDCSCICCLQPTLHKRESKFLK